jgi:hypothetical protein
MAYNVCKYADKRRPDMCQYYLLRSIALKKIMQEYESQNEKWGEQNHPMRGISDDTILIRGNTPYPEDSVLRGTLATLRYKNETNKGGWFGILQEEVCEAFLETDPVNQREKMIQAAAVAVQIIEYLDRRMEKV